ncbi:centriolar satellite-associated tubulin polyglutamylase complex regulator 1 isoform X2 [Narcine bancroftii]|uniref:centriolar satellite-associated tubulin polyglutamylase complex regulator 1 isoform X2 n=1 Tax=Narcine bancroftii TaxID=1343680 RepID=UPI003832302D
MSVDRFALSAEEYLSQTYVLTYIEDAVSQLLEYKEDHSKIGIARFLAEYFTSVKQGSHILFREFSFIKATPYNRASFIRMFWQCFRQIGKNGDLLTVIEYHSLLQLICHDLPMDLAQKAARIILMDDAMDCPMSFVDFLYAFQIRLYYYEFLESIAIIYQDLHMGKNPNTVIVPTSSIEQPLSPTSDTPTQEGVDAAQFYDCLETLCDRYKHKVQTRFRRTLPGLENPRKERLELSPWSMRPRNLRDFMRDIDSPFCYIPSVISTHSMKYYQHSSLRSIEQEATPVVLPQSQTILNMAHQWHNINYCVCHPSYPPTSYLKQILGKVERVTFFGFLMAIVKHEGINCKLGIVPSKAELFTDSKMDQELEKLINQMLSNPTTSTPTHREPTRKTQRKSLPHRKKVDVESDGSTEETDSSEN